MFCDGFLDFGSKMNKFIGLHICQMLLKPTKNDIMRAYLYQK